MNAFSYCDKCKKTVDVDVHFDINGEHMPLDSMTTAEVVFNFDVFMSALKSEFGDEYMKEHGLTREEAVEQVNEEFTQWRRKRRSKNCEVDN